MSKVVRDKEVCFIICSNDQLYTEESIYYIAHLHVPDGFEILDLKAFYLHGYLLWC